MTEFYISLALTKKKKKCIHALWPLIQLLHVVYMLMVGRVESQDRKVTCMTPFLHHGIRSFLGTYWKLSMTYRAAMPSSNTAARLCKPDVSRLPVNLSHKTCTTVDWRLLALPKNSCTWGNHNKHVWRITTPHMLFLIKVNNNQIKHTFTFYAWYNHVHQYSA